MPIPAELTRTSSRPNARVCSATIAHAVLLDGRRPRRRRARRARRPRPRPSRPCARRASVRSPRRAASARSQARCPDEPPVTSRASPYGASLRRSGGRSSAGHGKLVCAGPVKAPPLPRRRRRPRPPRRLALPTSMGRVKRVRLGSPTSRPPAAARRSTRPPDSRSCSRDSSRPRPRTCSSGSIPRTTRRSTSSTTSAPSSSRSTSSRRSSTTRPTSARSRRRTRSTTSSRWEARRCSRCRSPRSRRSCRSRRVARHLRRRRRSGARGGRAARGRPHDPRCRAEVRARRGRHRPPDGIWPKNGAQPGDALYLTKPLGTGARARRSEARHRR